MALTSKYFISNCSWMIFASFVSLSSTHVSLEHSKGNVANCLTNNNCLDRRMRTDWMVPLNMIMTFSIITSMWNALRLKNKLYHPQGALWWTKNARIFWQLHWQMINMRLGMRYYLHAYIPTAAWQTIPNRSAFYLLHNWANCFQEHFLVSDNLRAIKCERERFIEMCAAT